MKKLLLSLIFTVGTCNTFAQNQPIVLYGNDTQPPKAWLDGDSPKGFIVEIGQEILKEAGYSPKVQLMPFVRGLNYAKECKGVMTGVFKNPEREQYLLYSDPNVADSTVIVVKKGNEFAYSKLEDLSGKQVSFLKGSSFENSIKDMNDIKKDPLVKPDAMFKKLLNGRTDAVIINPGKASAVYASKDLGVNFDEAFSVLDTAVNTNLNYIVACNKEDNSEFIAKVNAATKALKDSGKIDAITKKYQ